MRHDHPDPAKPVRPAGTSSTTYRVFTALLGTVFVGMAVVILVISERSFGPLVATLVIGALGIDAIVSAIRNRLSWLARIGPLP